MIDPVTQLAKYVRDLLNVNERTILIGRVDEYDEQEKSLIVIDSIAPASQLSVSKTYDGENELMTIDTLYSEGFTINFYGVDARSNANLFITLNNTEEARTLRKTHEISVYRTNQITNLKRLAGKTFDNRYEITINATYNITNTINRLRFDEAQFGEVLVDY